MLSFLDPKDLNNNNNLLLKLYERFSEFVNDAQVLDNEYRTMKIDDIVKNLLVILV